MSAAGGRIRRHLEGRRTGERRSHLPDFVARCAGDELGHAEAPQADRAMDDRRTARRSGSLLPVWSVDAQDELVRRGTAVKDGLTARLRGKGLTQAQETWALWTLGRMALTDRNIDAWFAETGRHLSLNASIQAIRIAAHRIREAAQRPTARLRRCGAAGR